MSNSALVSLFLYDYDVSACKSNTTTCLAMKDRIFLIGLHSFSVKYL
jgi:hypothetical protein